MQKFIFAAWALSFSLIACQNKGTQSQAAESAGEGSNTISNVEPSSDFNTLNEQILADIIAARAYSRKFTPDYEESFDIIRNMKLALADKSDSERERMMKPIMEATNFRLLYEEHRGYSDMLDSLTITLADGRSTVESARTTYKEVREKMRAAQSKLEGERKRYLEVKGE
jgi:hypothetical protein